VPARGQASVYVIDRSMSMGLHGALELARKELLASLASLPETARFQVIAYNRSAEPLRLDGHADLLPASAENRRRAAAAIEELLPEGSTEHVQALKRALALQPDVIFFLTDADDLKLEQVRQVTQYNHRRTVIHAIELHLGRRARSESVLPLLAETNRGVYRAVGSPP
jgi:hypothetical protein